MNVSNKTTRLFTVSDITEDQAQDLFAICQAVEQNENDFRLEEMETAKNLRQALLNANVKPRGR